MKDLGPQEIRASCRAFGDQRPVDPAIRAECATVVTSGSPQLVERAEIAARRNDAVVEVNGFLRKPTRVWSPGSYGVLVQGRHRFMYFVQPRKRCSPIQMGSVLKQDSALDHDPDFDLILGGWSLQMMLCHMIIAQN